MNNTSTSTALPMDNSATNIKPPTVFYLSTHTWWDGARWWHRVVYVPPVRTPASLQAGIPPGGET